LSEHGYLRIRNWEKFQNADIFKKSSGRPPWVKFFVHNDAELQALSVPTRLLFYELLKVAGRHLNAFSNDSQWLVGEVRMEESVISQGLEELRSGGWLSHSKTKRRSRKILEKSERVGENKENRREEINPPNPPSGEVKGNGARTCPECGLSVEALPKSMTLADHRFRAHDVEAIDGRAA
jgi:hypothetical protein